jgi:hypothetical protein
MMRILFYSPGTTGSGHIVRGLSVAAALKRSRHPHEYAILSSEIPYVDLARRSGIPVTTFPLESEEMLSPERYRESGVFDSLASFKPDILIVEQFWFGLHSFVHDLPCKKVLLTFQMDPSVFQLKIRENEYRFHPEDYDLLLRTEPGYEVPFESREINPMVMLNRDEIMSREAALADLMLPEAAHACLFACSGEPAQVEDTWKSFSYLEAEGWIVIRSQHLDGGLFPVSDWFNAFDFLVSGAGYCAFWEARWFKKEAFFVPFPRRFEDQARRASIFSDYTFDTNGADELVRMLMAL